MRKFLDRGAVHLKDACTFTPGCDGRSLPHAYWTHLRFAWSVSTLLIKVALKGFAHALVPSVYGFNLIKEVYHVIWYLKQDIPDFPHWDKYEDMIKKMEKFK